jgi:hypothetical protein
VIRYGQYGRKESWIVKIYEKCPYLITIRLAFLPYFPYRFHYSTFLSSVFPISFHFYHNISENNKLL